MLSKLDIKNILSPYPLSSSILFAHVLYGAYNIENQEFDTIFTNTEAVV